MKQIFLNARIFTAEGKVIGNGFLECENGKIIDLGEMPNTGLDLKGKEVVNVNGNNLYPGFIDAHCHIGMLEDALDFEGDDLNESTDPVTPNLRGIDGLNPQDRCFTEALSAGITAACTGPGSANPIGGQMAVISLYGECADDMVIKSPAAVKCALGENPKRVYSERKQMPMTRMGNAALIRTQLEKAKRYMEKENPDYDEKCEGLIPVLKGEIPLHCHAHRLDDIFTAIRIAKEFGVKLVLVHATEGYLAAERLKKENVPMIQGPVLGDRCKPELKNADLKAMGILEKAGIYPALCTDHTVIPIQYLPICAGLCVREGLSENSALEAVTIRAAEILRVEDKIGSLKIGKNADFCIYEGSAFALNGICKETYIGGKLVYYKK